MRKGLKLSIPSIQSVKTKTTQKPTSTPQYQVNKMKIAVEGCCHGELDAIYASLNRLEQEKSQKVDLLLIGGDFQVFPTSKSEN